MHMYSHVPVCVELQLKFFIVPAYYWCNGIKQFEADSAQNPLIMMS